MLKNSYFIENLVNHILVVTIFFINNKKLINKIKYSECFNPYTKGMLFKSNTHKIGLHIIKEYIF